MRRTDVTYAQLDNVMRSLGFSRRDLKKEPQTRVYEHETGALFTTPPYPMDDFVLESHLVIARTTVDLFGIADRKVFDSKLQKAG